MDLDGRKTVIGLALLASGVFLLLFGTTSCITPGDIDAAKKSAKELARMACMSQPMLETNLVSAHYTVTTTGAVERYTIIIDKKAPKKRATAAPAAK